VRRIVTAAVGWVVLLGMGGPLGADDVHLAAAGPMGLGYVGLLYGLADPASGQWYVGSDLFGSDSRTWVGVADTGSSATLLGVSTQDAYVAYDGVGLPLEPYPQVQFGDEGFGGTETFAVTEPIQIRIADFKTAFDSGNLEDPALFSAYGPVGGPEPPATRMGAARELIGGGFFGVDFDILGMSVMQGRVLAVDPHYLETLRLFLFVMAGSLERTPPRPSNPYALYVPVELVSFFEDPQPVDVGAHPMLPMHLRRGPSDPLVARTALFDSGSPVNFVSESFAAEAGIDLNSTPELTIPVTGVGGVQVTRPGWYVDTLGLELGKLHAGDMLLVGNTAVFVIPDEEMPGGLDAILGNGVFSPSSDLADTSVVEWYVDTRHPEESYLIVVVPGTPGDANGDGLADEGDYAAWLAHYGQPGGLSEGDFNGDGIVNGADYTIWADYYAGGAGQVPEPGTLALLVGGALLAALRLRRDSTPGRRA